MTNNKHIQELTFRLSHALDQNYDVVNLDTVLSVISALEGATITKEQLEATRLAKYINQLRRRTKSEQLARRAKSLLKKWREMVGIQPQTAEALSDHNTVMREEYHQRSQPTSPIAASNNVELSDEKIVPKISMGEFLRCSPSNPDVTLMTAGSGDMKKKSVVGTYQSKVPTRCVPKAGNSQSRAHVIKSDICNQQQPTSFANLLTGITSSSPLLTENTCDTLSTSSSRKTFKRKDRSHDRSVGMNIATKTIVVDQSSSSNADSSRTTIVKNELPVSNMFPVVIDIQDSNSSSNPTHILPSVGSNSGMCISKAKKIKKDRKHKDREHQQSAPIPSCPNAGYISNVIDESSSSQKVKIELEYDKFDDRSRVKYPLSGMSEILSLSNSSMSSMFPNSTAVGSSITGSAFATNSQRKAETSVRGDSSHVQAISLSTSDLTFTGKFKQHSLAFSSDLSSPPLDTAATTKDLSLTHTFQPFSSSGCNSIDSTSNSRVSQFDIIDVVNQDKNQTKIIDELLQSKKKYTSNLSVQQNLQKSTMIADSAAQILMPPTSVRQLNTSVDEPHVYTEAKVPKKRGRKKGSKGVDSVIAKETSLSSQMLMTTLGCKKVKTTKELYAEMQNRKLGVSLPSTSPTLSNWLIHQQVSNQISRPNSSCSDACSTNATISTVATRSTPDKTYYNNVHGEDIGESDSETNSSDHSRDSAATHQLSRLSTDSTSNSQLTSKANRLSLATLPIGLSVDSIKKQIEGLLTHLPEVPSIGEIELKYLDDAFSCTCQIIEKVPPGIEFSQNLDDTNNLLLPTTVHPTKDEEDVKKEQPIIDTVNLYSSPSKKIHSNDDSILSSKTPTQMIKKSIFDLDFDDDEDPLHKIRAEAAAKPAQEYKIENVDAKSNCVKNIELSSKLNKQNISVMPIDFHKEPSKGMNSTIAQKPQEVMFLPFYTIEEDSQCKAKQRYEIQTQQITKYHITALHNCYMPNVNGNWDNAEVATSLPKVKEEEIKDVELANPLNPPQNVVPKYGSLVTEYIPKDLRHIHLIPKLKLKRKSRMNDASHSFLPFLGVARLQCDFEKIKRNKELNASRKHEEQCNEKVKGLDVLKDLKINVEIENKIDDYAVIKCEDNKSAYVGAAKRDYNEHTEFQDSINSGNSDIFKENFCENSFDEISTQNLNENANCNQLYQNQNDQNINNNGANTEDKQVFKTIHSGKADKHVDSRRSSTCSNSSLKQNQNSINVKLRRRLQQQRKINRKSVVPNHRSYGKRSRGNSFNRNEDIFKGLQIAINGNVAAQRQISMESSYNSNEEDYEEDEEAFNNSSDSINSQLEDEIIDEHGDEDIDDDVDYHEVVTRNVSTTSSGNNHIVLMIKKTPSKINSSSDSPKQVPVSKFVDSSDSGDSDRVVAFDKVNTVIQKNLEQGIQKCSRFQNMKIDAGNKIINERNLSECKLILDGISIVKEDNATSSAHNNGVLSLKNSGFLNSFNSVCLSPEHGNQNQRLRQRRTSRDGNLEHVEFPNTINDVETDFTIISDYEEKHQQIPNESCDVFKSFYNINENSKLDSSYNSLKWIGESYSGNDSDSNDKNIATNVKSNIKNVDINTNSEAQTTVASPSWEQKLVPPKEYGIGLPAVDDVHDDGNNSVHIQQFKEWHQVLQLRSYNDELLTVLPYVVLE